jgi:hypothetical protein
MFLLGMRPPDVPAIVCATRIEERPEQTDKADQNFALAALTVDCQQVFGETLRRLSSSN